MQPHEDGGLDEEDGGACGPVIVWRVTFWVGKCGPGRSGGTVKCVRYAYCMCDALCVCVSFSLLRAIIIITHQPCVLQGMFSGQGSDRKLEDGTRSWILRPGVCVCCF